MRRKKIPLEQQLAAALACLLPQAQRDELRHARVPAKAVIRLFTMHHVEFFALGGGCEWHNLHPMTRPAHDARFAADVAAIAKVKRLASVMAMAEVIDRQMPRRPQRTGRGAFCGPAAGKPRPKRKIASRPFPKRQRGCNHANPHRTAP